MTSAATTPGVLDEGVTRTALLVDFGGVLTSPVLDAFAALSQECGLAKGEALRLLTQDEQARSALVEHEEGRLDDAGFEEALGAAVVRAGGHLPDRSLLATLDAHMELDTAMIDLVREVRAAGIPVALVSNSLGRGCYDRVDLDELFDVAVISGRVGVRKPSRRIYTIACERLGVAPQECVLVDDLEHNLAGAARLGVLGVHHRDAALSAPQVRRSLGLPVPATP